MFTSNSIIISLARTIKLELRIYDNDVSIFFFYSLTDIEKVSADVYII